MNLQSIKQRLRSKHAVVPDDWLTGCVNFLLEQNPGLDQNSILNEVYEYWLGSDLRDLDSSSLPQINPNLVTVLNGTYVVQVISCIDIGSSFYSQHQKLTKTENENSAVSASVKEDIPPWESKPKRCLSFELTDGTQSLKGLEHKPLQQTIDHFAPGAKLLLKGQVKVRRKTVLLAADNMTLLGGNVPDLVEQFAVKNIIAEKIGRNAPQQRDTQPALQHNVAPAAVQNIPPPPAVQQLAAPRRTPVVSQQQQTFSAIIPTVRPQTLPDSPPPDNIEDAFILDDLDDDTQENMIDEQNDPSSSRYSAIVQNNFICEPPSKQWFDEHYGNEMDDAGEVNDHQEDFSPDDHDQDSPEVDPADVHGDSLTASDFELEDEKDAISYSPTVQIEVDKEQPFGFDLLRSSPESCASGSRSERRRPRSPEIQDACLKQALQIWTILPKSVCGKKRIRGNIVSIVKPLSNNNGTQWTMVASVNDGSDQTDMPFHDALITKLIGLNAFEAEGVRRCTDPVMKRAGNDKLRDFESLLKKRDLIMIIEFPDTTDTAPVVVDMHSNQS